MVIENESFEDCLKKLEDRAAKLSSEDISLEEAIKCYEEGAAYYKACNEILESARQKIVTIGKDETSGAMDDEG